MKSAAQGGGESIVAEVTPRLRAKHPKWTANAFNRLAQKHSRVRISGWLMLDQEHPEQLQQTRATLWEIHPIMQIEVDKAGQQWVKLDDED
jgi:hypothetical protein